MSTPRIIIAAFGLGIAALGIYWCAAGYLWNGRCDAWEAEEPVRFTIDPRVEKSYAVPFRQTCFVPHVCFLMLDVPAPPIDSDTEEFLAVAATFDAVPTLTTDGGAPVDLSFQRHNHRPDCSRPLVLRSFYSVPEGEYTLTLAVQPSTSGDMPPTVDLVLRRELGGKARFGIVGIVFGSALAIVGTGIGLAARPWRRPLHASTLATSSIAA